MIISFFGKIIEKSINEKCDSKIPNVFISKTENENEK
jgi:hypothetical protein